MSSLFEQYAPLAFSGSQSAGKSWRRSRNCPLSNPAAAGEALLLRLARRPPVCILERTRVVAWLLLPSPMKPCLSDLSGALWSSSGASRITSRSLSGSCCLASIGLFTFPCISRSFASLLLGFTNWHADWQDGLHRGSKLRTMLSRRSGASGPMVGNTVFFTVEYLGPQSRHFARDWPSGSAISNGASGCSV